MKYSALPSRTKRNALFELAVDGERRRQHRPGAGQLAVAPGLVHDHAEAVVLVQVRIEVDVVLEHLVGQWFSCALPVPSARAERNSDLPTVPVSTTVRVVVSCGTRALAHRVAAEFVFGRLAVVVDAHTAHAAVGRQVEPRSRRPAAACRSIGCRVGCFATRSNSRCGMLSWSNTALRVCPALRVTVCQRSPLAPPFACSCGSGSRNEARCAFAGDCSAWSKAGTSANSSAPQVANRAGVRPVAPGPAALAFGNAFGGAGARCAAMAREVAVADAAVAALVEFLHGWPRA